MALPGSGARRYPVEPGHRAGIAGDLLVRYEGLYELEGYEPGASGPPIRA